MRSAMTRRRKTITFSLLPEIAEQVREVTREDEMRRIRRGAGAAQETRID